MCRTTRALERRPRRSLSHRVVEVVPMLPALPVLHRHHPPLRWTGCAGLSVARIQNINNTQSADRDNLATCVRIYSLLLECDGTTCVGVQFALVACVRSHGALSCRWFRGKVTSFAMGARMRIKRGHAVGARMLSLSVRTRAAAGVSARKGGTLAFR